MQIVNFGKKPGYYMKPLTLEAVKIFKGTEGRITIAKNGENVPQREFTKVVLLP